MIEFVLKNRRLRLHPDGTMYVRAYRKNAETKTEKWIELKFHITANGYKQCGITVDSINMGFYEHRLIYYANNQSWDIFNSSMDNCIDHYNRKRDDNRIENLHVVTNQQNQWNKEHKGYYWDKSRNKWQASIITNGKSKFLGRFVNEVDARTAYLEAKEKYHIP